MTSLKRFALAAGLALVPATSLVAQDDSANPPRYRVLAPGVEKTIIAERDAFELTSRHDLPELLQVDNNFDFAKDVSFRHDVWALDFTFKPVRFIDIELPGPDGTLRTKRIWYMVYHVNNPGVVYRAGDTRFTDVAPDPRTDELTAARDVDTTRQTLNLGQIQEINKGEPVKFVPSFLLYSRDNRKAYLDRVIPVAIQAIEEREDKNRKLQDSVAISGEIPASDEQRDNSVWGVVTWEDIDPETDFFSIYVQGLTNAYKWVDTPEGRKYAYKTLRLDFWRPGDDLEETEDEIRFLKSTWQWLDVDWAPIPDQE
jgi:hypothetical protein